MQLNYLPTQFYGWDIGGAHLKLANCNQEGLIQEVTQFPCPLWQGIHELETVIKAIIAERPFTQTTHHAITMTGELVDAFEHREQGVNEILNCIARCLPIKNCYIFAGQHGWLNINDAKKNWQKVASMNWKASAYYAAMNSNSGLFIDIGSTTADIISFANGQLQLQGETDFERQISGELVYTGAIRTPLMAICQTAPFKNQTVRLAAEWFATSADVWRLLDQLSIEQIQDPSADGKSWHTDHCRQRLARMLGADANLATNETWQAVAEHFATQQLNQLLDACHQVIHASQLADTAPLIGAGVGRFMVKMCAERLGRPYRDFSELTACTPNAADHAPAAALALLAQQQLA